jgi:hypothetical protein
MAKSKWIRLQRSNASWTRRLWLRLVSSFLLEKFLLICIVQKTVLRKRLKKWPVMTSILLMWCLKNESVHVHIQLVTTSTITTWSFIEIKPESNIINLTNDASERLINPSRCAVALKTIGLTWWMMRSGRYAEWSTWNSMSCWLSSEWGTIFKITVWHHFY